MDQAGRISVVHADNFAARRLKAQVRRSQFDAARRIKQPRAAASGGQFLDQFISRSTV
jgi:hypothetical protein